MSVGLIAPPAASSSLIRPTPDGSPAASGPSIEREGRIARRLREPHAFWAPGVRLFQQLRFGWKACLISLAFLVPLLVLALAYEASTRATVAQARSELHGVDGLQALEPWMIEVQKQRRLVLSGMAAEVDMAAIERSRSRFQAVVASMPAEIDLRRALQAAAAAQQSLAQGGLTASSPQFEWRMQHYVKTLVDLRTELLDESALTLDPDQDSYYLMTVAGEISSDLIESISRSRAVAGALQRAQAADAAEVRRLYGTWFQGQDRIADLMKAAERAGQMNARVKTTLDPAKASQAAEAFFTAASSAWFDDTFRADVERLNPVGQTAVNELRALAERSTVLLRELLQKRLEATERSRRLVGGLGAACLLVAAYLFYAFYRSMAGGLGEVGRHLEAMTRGDLTERAEPRGRDEAAHLVGLLAQMQEGLRAMVAQVRQASHGIVTASSQIAAGSSDLSARTEQTAASLEESASAMEQIGATVRQTAANTEEATQMAARNATLATRGGAVMADMVGTMQAIQESSSRIADIIGVIDAIAFQTNILALNAAVEAARAGEQGRGFAVVASEVRALAKRTTDAAREIKSLISTSVERVERGTTVAQDAGAAIQEIVGSAERIQALLSEIATGSREQTDGIGHVSDAVQQLDRSTQQNAAMVEETAAAAASLLDQANGLVTQVGRFRLP